MKNTLSLVEVKGKVSKSLNVTVFNLKSRIAEELLRKQRPKINCSFKSSTIYTETGSVSDDKPSIKSVVPIILSFDPLAEKSDRVLRSVRG